MTTSTVKQEQKPAGSTVLNLVVGLAIVVLLGILARYLKVQVYDIKDIGGGIPGKVLEYPLWAALVGLIANAVLKASQVL
jgi:hypothetical protein